MLVLQTILVTVLVIASAVFAIWRLSSTSLRLRILDALAPAEKYFNAHWLTKLRLTTLEQLNHGCSTCAANGKIKDPQA